MVAGGAGLAVGCSDDAKKSEPKFSDGVKADPRLKPAEAGGAPAQSGASGAVGAVKGD